MSYDHIMNNINSKNVDYNRILSISHLFGLRPVFNNLKILEIGCGDGLRLIAAAEQNPDNVYVGISDCMAMIQEGQNVLEEITFSNINLYNISIESFLEANDIIFDLIIINNVFSWVGQTDQMCLLTIIEKYLSTNGVAFIDYNTMPGWHMQNALRGMIQHHVQSYADKLDKIKHAKSLLSFLKENSISCKEEKELLIHDIDMIEKLSDVDFYKEYISEHNWPVYFSNMIGKLNSFNLAYIADYDLMTMSSQDMPKGAKDALLLSPNLVESEQYMDFFRNRRNRKSIICKAEAVICSQNGLEPTRLYDMYLSANGLTISANVNELCNEEPLVINAGGILQFTVTDPLIKVALKMLADHSPGQLSFSNLLSSSSECLNIAGHSCDIVKQREILAYQFMLLYSCLSINTIDITANKRNIASYVHHRPRTTRLARHLAKAARPVVNLNLNAVMLDDNERRILHLLDGSLSYVKLVDAFEGSFDNEAVDKSGYVLATLNKFLSNALLIN